MRRSLSLSLVLLLGLGSAAAAKTTRFWNLTANPITSFALAPTGTGAFGPDLSKSDSDGSVDHDERMKVNGLASGTYDARLSDSKGRSCVIKGIVVKDGQVFSIDEKQMQACGK